MMTDEEIQAMSLHVEDRLEEIENLKNTFIKKKTFADRATLAAQEAAERYYQILWLSDIIIDRLISDRLTAEIQNPTPRRQMLPQREESLKEQRYG